mgnify:FL=1
MKQDKRTLNETKLLLKELPYFNENILLSHGQFNNLQMPSNLPTKRYLNKLHSLYDLDLFTTNFSPKLDINPDSQIQLNNIKSNYYSAPSFQS